MANNVVLTIFLVLVRVMAVALVSLYFDVFKMHSCIRHTLTSMIKFTSHSDLIPKCLEAIALHGIIVDDTLMNEVNRSIACQTERNVAKPELILAMEHVVWNVSTTWNVDSIHLLFLRVSVVPLSSLPISMKSTLVSTKLLGSGKSPTPAIRLVVDIEVSNVVQSCDLGFSCPHCGPSDSLPSFFLPEHCVSSASNYHVENIIISRRERTKFKPLNFSQQLTGAFYSNAEFNYSTSMVYMNVSNLRSIAITNMDYDYPWYELFPCAGFNGSTLEDCCQSYPTFALQYVNVRNVTSFPYQELSSSLLCWMPQLSTLSIEKLPVSVIHADIFEHNPAVNELYLIGTNISELPENLLVNKMMTNFCLRQNQISLIENGFCRDTFVEHFDLSHNGLRDFDVESLLFENNCQIGSFNVSSNALTSFSGLSKRGHPSWESNMTNFIDLSHNHLTASHSFSFSDLPGLMLLNLSFNEISSENLAPDFLTNSCLESGCNVDLSHNVLSDGAMKFSSLFRNVSLTSLDLSYNQLLTFPYDIRNVELAPIQQPFEQTKKYRTVGFNLRGNQFTSIDHPICVNYHMLHAFYDLSNGHVRRISPEAFSCDEDLTSQSKLGLNLRNNPLADFPGPSSGYLSHLTLLSLSGTNVKTLPCSVSMQYPLLKVLNIGPINSSDSSGGVLPNCCLLKHLMGTVNLQLKIQPENYTEILELFAVYQHIQPTGQMDKEINNTKCTYGADNHQVTSLREYVSRPEANGCWNSKQWCESNTNIEGESSEIVFFIPFSLCGGYLVCCILTCIARKRCFKPQADNEALHWSCMISALAETKRNSSHASCEDTHVGMHPTHHSHVYYDVKDVVGSTYTYWHGAYYELSLHLSCGSPVHTESVP